MKSWLITLLVCVVVFEIIEHLVLPLFWAVRHRGRKSAHGPSGMIGKECVVKEWSGNRGRVRVGPELWNASSESSLIAGEKAVVKDIKGLTLTISPSALPDDTPGKSPARLKS